jgi:hypothetical protein
LARDEGLSIPLAHQARTTITNQFYQKITQSLSETERRQIDAWLQADAETSSPDCWGALRPSFKRWAICGSIPQSGCSGATQRFGQGGDDCLVLPQTRRQLAKALRPLYQGAQSQHNDLAGQTPLADEGWFKTLKH